MSEYIQYIVPCLTEELGITTGFLSTVPTTCPNNTAHTIDPTGIRIMKILANKTVVVNQNTDTTIGGFYRIDHYSFNVPASTVTTKDIFYPYNINVLLATYLVTLDNIGDTLDMCAVPNTTCAQLDSDLAIGSTSLYANTVYTILNHGFNLVVTDGTNTDDLGEIKTYNLSTGIITFSNPTTHTFVTGNLVKMTIYRVKNLKVVNNSNIVIGLKKINGVGLPANKIMRFIYTNNSAVDKTFNFSLEFGY